MSTSERELLLKLQSILGPSLTESDQLIAPVFGDDAALIRLPDRTLVVTQDLLVEHIDFRRDWGTLADAGYKAVMANLSDLAAKGATPRWGFCSVACPKTTAESDLEAIYTGMREAAEGTGLVIAGGDLSSTAGPVTIDLTLIGEIAAGQPLWLRSDANPGDVVWLCGEVGWARLGLLALQQGRGEVELPGLPQALRAYQRPIARLRASRLLREAAYRGACMDVSDGLLRDVPRLAEASRVGIEVALDFMLCSDFFLLAEAFELEPHTVALTGGEDFALLGACDPAEYARLRNLDLGYLVAIGRCVMEPGVRLREGDRLLPWPTGGFDHFADPSA